MANKKLQGDVGASDGARLEFGPDDAGATIQTPAGEFVWNGEAFESTGGSTPTPPEDDALWGFNPDAAEFLVSRLPDPSKEGEALLSKIRDAANDGKLSEDQIDKALAFRKQVIDAGGRQPFSRQRLAAACAGQDIEEIANHKDSDVWAAIEAAMEAGL